jgi:hypothetical protein
MQVSVQKYGEKAIRLPVSGGSFPIGIDLGFGERPSRFADVRQSSGPDGAILEIATAWWGKRPHELLATTRQQEVAVLREMLGKCATNDASRSSVIECTLSPGRHSKDGCEN